MTTDAPLRSTLDHRPRSARSWWLAWPRATLALFLLGLAACGGTLAPSSSLPPSAPSPLVGKRMPDFALPAVDGTKVDTAALRGKVLVVKFFANYCAPCKKTLPAAEQLSKSRPEVAVIGISEDELAAEAQQTVTTYGLTFPVVHDRDNLVAGRFQVTEMPIAFVVDGAGMIRWAADDTHDEADLVRAVEAAGR